MLEAFYDKINDYGSVTIKVASPKDIRDWSFGEVKKPETINYRTHRAEKDGLFCERIFGPERDWECYCGKYKGIKHKGIVCDRCGVKIAHSKVRRKRMGHINLASPVAHIWFFKSTPSHMSILLGMKTNALERVIYFQDYVTIDPGDAPVKKYDLLSEERYRELQFKHGNLKAKMGAEAVKELLNELNLEELIESLQKDYKKTGSKQKQKEIIKRLKLAKMILESGNRPDWMVMDVIPVIPPDLRPLIMLESGTFATSDLNDLYRRLINRNNRLKKLLDMNAPDVIIKNEKRMLQQSVDALFDNSRCKRPVVGSGNRPLKSLTDMIKGKQGRFRENLLGKRVDYSGRSVIVVGPELRLNQCALPKKIALELFQPFIIRRLKELGFADTIKSAKKMLEKKDERVWDILEDVVRSHPVLLNRAPTLHRMGIQAFYPILTEGNAIKIHPLVCTGFNADFDGDQMAVHLPLSIEAQVEASTLMISTNNIFSPANGQPVIAPTQDMILGCYYLTKEKTGEPGEGAVMSSFDEVFMAHFHGKVTYHSVIYYEVSRNRAVDPKPPEDHWRGRALKTTVGRVFFNSILPEGMPYYNRHLNKKGVHGVISMCYRLLGRRATIILLDAVKSLGFHIATRSGISITKDNLLVPPQKQTIVRETYDKIERIEDAYTTGAITDQERHNGIIDNWTQARELVGQAMMDGLSKDRGVDSRSFNPFYVMADSGARGSQEQIRQLAGMRGLMAKPNGAIIETPIIANFREGLKVLDYFSSTHGARKGLADTALKTADAGYLTRKLADVAQNVVITEHNCGTIHGVSKGFVKQGEEVKVSLSQNVRGRTARDTITNKQTGEVIVREHELITEDIAAKIEALGYDKIRVRSPLTCQASLGICALCYGMDLSLGKLVEEGMAVGIIAAQSIGEPGTQLTMRTFHIGGIAMKPREEDQVRLAVKGTRVAIYFKNIRVVENQNHDHVVINQKATLTLHHEEVIAVPAGGMLKVVTLQPVVPKTQSEVVATKGPKEIKAHMAGTVKRIEGEVDPKSNRVPDGCTVTIVSEEEFPVPLGAMLQPLPDIGVIHDGIILPNSEKSYLIARWDPLNSPILSEKAGMVRYDDIIPNITMREEPHQGKIVKRIIEHKGEHHPSLIIEDDNGNNVSICSLPEKAHIEVEDGVRITAGTMLAKIPREVTGTQDITGGLPRVTELLEARRPKNPAVISEIEGVVKLGDKRRGKRIVTVENEESGSKREHLVPHGKELRVHNGDRVKAGDALVDGPKVPHDILRCCSVNELQEYLLDEIQSVYRSQSVTIDDKHIEIIIAQMMRKVKVDRPGDTDFLPGSVVDKFKFRAANERILNEGKKGATYKPLLLGITKASLQSESFISAASFQETTKVLTDAALSGKRDDLQGLKENVILGHMIPAGTGFKKHFRTYVKVEGETVHEEPEVAVTARENVPEGKKNMREE
jgi:DNA-directed RNA polymerase subunit beta'